MTSEALLFTERLVKTYRKRRVVDGVDLEVHPGEIVGLLGPNGAGKTTTFRMTVGMVRPDAGRIWFDGRDITAAPMYRRARLGLGYLPQEVSVFRRMTVEGNVLAVLETLALRRSERRKRLEELLDFLGLAHLRKSHAEVLSGGEKRRLEITRALATDPQMILLDEPFAGVDPKTVHEIQRILQELRERRGIAILLTDHSVRETLGVTDRSYIIADGNIIFDGSPAEAPLDPEVRRTYLGEDFRM
ncbi:MAG: LPS export ABC transporter ATP-binding protein [Planctomycetes bacterium]|nr:LPS export ABC transporter ATP-binding protein [Planctomycetota bacterium]MCB9890893.1 LPS export ABC transporter ATP-binding protein [Planctomycetota bacterium]